MKRKQKSWDKATLNKSSQEGGWRGPASKNNGVFCNIPTIWKSEWIKAQFMLRHSLASICTLQDGVLDHIFCLYMAWGVCH